MSLLTPIEIPAGKHVLRILNNEGDRTITYDPTVEAERITAEAALEESVAKGGTAFVLETESGGQGYVTRTLEQEAVHTVVEPRYVGG